MITKLSPQDNLWDIRFSPPKDATMSPRSPSTAMDEPTVTALTLTPNHARCSARARAPLPPALRDQGPRHIRPGALPDAPMACIRSRGGVEPESVAAGES